jgi:hypothetical protein
VENNYCAISFLSSLQIVVHSSETLYCSGSYDACSETLASSGFQRRGLNKNKICGFLQPAKILAGPDFQPKIKF